MRGTISMLASSLNDVNCDGYNSNFCSKTYNRYSCRSVAQTCGACLDGYIGETSDSNTVCYSTIDVNTAVANGMVIGASSSVDFYASHMSKNGFVVSRYDDYLYDPSR